MERETLTGLLVLILGGLSLQLCAGRWVTGHDHSDAWQAERQAWWRLWQPLLPASWVGMCLLGWALAEPDPVQDRMNPGVVVLLALPFLLLVCRALIRAWLSLLKLHPRPLIYTHGLLRPRLCCDAALQARWTPAEWLAVYLHEYAHRQHRDPLRVWLAQIAVDLLWPWPAALNRFQVWLEHLERLRDIEAVSLGADRTDLAAAVLKTVRFQMEKGGTIRGWVGNGAVASLTGSEIFLRQRIDHLLHAERRQRPKVRWVVTLITLTGLWMSGLFVGCRLAAPMVSYLLSWTL